MHVLCIHTYPLLFALAPARVNCLLLTLPLPLLPPPRAPDDYLTDDDGTPGGGGGQPSPSNNKRGLAAMAAADAIASLADTNRGGGSGGGMGSSASSSSSLLSLASGGGGGGGGVGGAEWAGVAGRGPPVAPRCDYVVDKFLGRKVFLVQVSSVRITKRVVTVKNSSSIMLCTVPVCVMCVRVCMCMRV